MGFGTVLLTIPENDPQESNRNIESTIAESHYNEETPAFVFSPGKLTSLSPTATPSTLVVVL
jgi:hypothetical protein